MLCTENNTPPPTSECSLVDDGEMKKVERLSITSDSDTSNADSDHSSLTGGVVADTSSSSDDSMAQLHYPQENFSKSMSCLNIEDSDFDEEILTKPGDIRKTVSFGNIKTFEVEKLLDYENAKKNLKEKMWYSRVELDYIATKNMDLADKAICKGIKSVDAKGKQTIRGLEYLLKNNKLTIKRQILQNQSRVAVLCEQRRQRELGIQDPVLIKAAYKANGAKKCQQVATNLGLHDEDVATKLQQQKQSKAKAIFNKILNKPVMSTIKEPKASKISARTA